MALTEVRRPHSHVAMASSSTSTGSTVWDFGPASAKLSSSDDFVQGDAGGCIFDEWYRVAVMFAKGQLEDHGGTISPPLSARTLSHTHMVVVVVVSHTASPHRCCCYD